MKIESFSGEHRFLSNFYPATITTGWWTWSTNEHAYQAAKSLDRGEWATIQGLKTPGEAKRFGRRIQIRPEWDDIKLDVMAELVAYKFDQHPYLKEKLLQTKGIELIEGNHWGDIFWGVCRGVGQNHLGKILMEYRDQGENHGPQAS